MSRGGKIMRLKRYAEVVWTTDDVRTLFDISEDEADEWLFSNQNRIRDRLIELGWDVIQTLGDMDDLAKGDTDDN